MREFTATVTVRGWNFTGQGSSKKAAKAAAAEQALKHLDNIQSVPGREARVSNIPAGQAPWFVDLGPDVSQMLADRIGKLGEEKYNEVVSELSTAGVSLRKTLAAIVMMKGSSGSGMVSDEVGGEVIALGTGTKCITGDSISESGLAVNDCHAEVVARRAFLRFLYSQLELCTKGKESASIFVRADSSGRHCLKPGISFHLYISTAPCGDARVFSPSDEKQSSGDDAHPQRLSRGVVRVKVEAGEGTVPAQNQCQTWDGILAGQQLHTMSCSDKLARWNVLGLQGALLSLYIEPIYLRSIIIGSLFNEHHILRAVYNRVSGLQGLPELYTPTLPLLHAVSHPPNRMVGKSSQKSLNWSWGDAEPEIVNGQTGRLENLVPSQICKQVLFEQFFHLWDSLAPDVVRSTVTERRLLPLSVARGLCGGSGSEGLSEQEQEIDSQLPFFVVDATPSEVNYTEEGDEGEEEERKETPRRKSKRRSRAQKEEEEEKEKQEASPQPRRKKMRLEKQEEEAREVSNGPEGTNGGGQVATRRAPSLPSHLLRTHCSYGAVKSLATEYQAAKQLLSDHLKAHWGSGWIKKPPDQENFKL